MKIIFEKKNKIINILNKNLINFKKKIKLIKNINDLYILKSEYLGKNSFFIKITNNFYKINNINKSIIGKSLNFFKNEINSFYNLKKKNILYINNKLNINIDATISFKENNIGSLHPISIAIIEIENKFIKLGFDLLNGEEIEDPYHNFDLLNIPINHPSRSEKDTFWINDNYLLRTQTSSIQSRLLKKNKFPIKIISYGKVFRRDKDKTHTPMFHQIDGLYIDKNINFSNLKYILNEFIYDFFNNKKNIKLRYRSSYFPFTEPSIEIDIMMNKKWIEVIGAGMINSKILSNLKINNNFYSGFAFGIGIERLVMLKYNIKNINCLFENDLKFLNQFKYIK